MAKSDAEITGDALSEFFAKPPPEKALKNPAFRFLLVIVSTVLEKTEFPKGLFDADQLAPLMKDFPHPLKVILKNISTPTGDWGPTASHVISLIISFSIATGAHVLHVLQETAKKVGFVRHLLHLVRLGEPQGVASKLKGVDPREV
jgi:hypothetical protein